MVTACRNRRCLSGTPPPGGLPIGLVTLFLARRLVDESTAPSRLKVDPLGALIAAVGVFLVIFPVIQGRDAGWPIWVWIMLGASGPVFVLFVFVERSKTRRGGSPVVDLELFRNRGFATTLVVSLIFFAGVTAIAFTLMVFLQTGFGFSAFRSGLALVPLAFGLIVGAGMSINLSKKLGNFVLVIGALVSLASVLWLASVISSHTESLSSWSIVAPLGVIGLGLGLFVAPLNDVVLAGAPPQSAGSASGLQSTMIQAGNAVGVAVLGVILFGALAYNAAPSSPKAAPRLQQNLVAAGLPAHAAAQAADHAAACFHDRMKASDPTSTPAGCVAGPAALPPAAVSAIRAAATTTIRADFAGSMQRTLYWNASAFGAAGLLVLAIPKRRRAPGTS